jgi:hypothetical protein
MPVLVSTCQRAFARAVCALLALGAALFVVPEACAHVVWVVVESRGDVAGGATFGAGGAYERITGRMLFALDPLNPHNRQIVDLALAPRNARGEVEAWAEFVILRPRDPSRGNGVALIDVVNRGGMTTRVFHLGARPDASPDSAAFYGDALLLRRGITVVHLGWQWDVAPGGGRLHFGAPPVRAADGAGPVTGLVRSDLTVDAPTRLLPLGHGLGAGHVPYPVADPDDPASVLTVRDTPLGARRVVPRDRWRFTADTTGTTGEPGAPGASAADGLRFVHLADGFQPGKIYELVYRAKDPVVVGAGLAAVRDVASYLKHDADRDSARVARGIRHVVAYGVSQTGRFLRHYLYQGFNTDERGRQALDGIFAHTAGAGRGSFNHRFAQPSRDAQPYSTFFYPTDLFPFTSRVTTDPVTGARDGLLARAEPRHRPRVFYVDGGYEYWGRAASLTHTTPDGRRDVGFHPNERRYVVASAQHSSPALFPPPPAAALDGEGAARAYRGNPLDQRLALRALLVALVDWVRDDRAPPPSQLPTLESGALVAPGQVRFPTIPGLAVARTPYRPHRLDLGPGWPRGRVDREPPGVGAPFPVFVMQVDSLGNELGGIRPVELLAPLATYYPWHLRTRAPAGREHLASFAGTFVPLPATEAERRQWGDARPSVERLYGSKGRFMERVEQAVQSLVARGFLLAEDAPTARLRMEDTWDFVVGGR